MGAADPQTVPNHWHSTNFIILYFNAISIVSSLSVHGLPCFFGSLQEERSLCVHLTTAQGLILTAQSPW